MPRIFISHSSKNDEWAHRIKDWLEKNGWSDFFLDLDPERGIKGGERWKEALQKAAYRCEVVLALVSQEWLGSAYCHVEIDAARLLNKKIIVALISPLSRDALTGLSEEQWVDLVSDPDGFLKLKISLKQAGLDPASFPFPAGRRLYPGFAALDESDAAIFFGREAEIVRGLDKIRGLSRGGVIRSMVIIGASGAGKSSFLRAGLWPRLKRDDRTWLPLPVIRPERAVISGGSGLARSLQDILLEEPFASHLKGHPFPKARASIANYIVRDQTGLETMLAAIGEAGRLVLPGETALLPTVILSIDQGEELFNGEGREEAQLFLKMLARALDANPHLFVLIAMRSDVFPQLQNDPVMAKVQKEVFPLDMMLEGSYRDIIEGPAALAKPEPLKIDPELTHALLEDVSGQDALPLLAFTLERLYDNFGAEGKLTLAQYEMLGRVKGAISAAVEDALSSGMKTGEVPKDPKAQQALIASAFIPHLVRVNPAGQFIRRIAAREEIPPAGAALLDHLSKSRLIVKDRRALAGAETDTFEVAHEALFRVWRPLNSALENERVFLAGKSQLEEDVKDWQQAPEKGKAGALLAGNKLARAQEWLFQRPNDLTGEERAYIKASISREASKRQWRRIAAVFAFVSISLFAGFAAFEWRQASQQAARAEHATAFALDSSNKLIARIRTLFNKTAVSSAAMKDLLTTAEDSITAQLKLGLDHSSEIKISIAHLLVLFSDVYANLGNTPKSLESALKANGMAEAELKLDRDTKAWQSLEYESLYRIADALMRQSKQPEGLKYYKKALEVAETRANAAPNDATWQQNIAFMERKMGDLAQDSQEALSHFEKSYRIYEALRASMPDNADISRDLASTISRIGDLLRPKDKEASLAKYREALVIRERLETASPENQIILSNIADNHTKIANALFDLNDVEGALKEHRISLQYRERLATLDSTNSFWRSQQANGYYYLAGALRKSGQFGAALEYYTKALPIRSELAGDLTDITWALALANVHLETGQTLAQLNKRDDAINAYRNALSIYETLRAGRPKSDARRRDVFTTRMSIGDLFLEGNDPAKALEEFRAGLPIAAQMIEEDSKSAVWQYGLWDVTAKIGLALKAQNAKKEALAQFQIALPLIEALIAKSPGNSEWQHAGELTKAWIAEASEMH